MVTTVNGYSDSRNRATVGSGYDGVVRLSVGGYAGTGVLLYDGKAVLTAAHLFSHGSTAASVRFETTQGTQSISSASVSVYNSYDASNENGDLALVWLSQAAPTSAERYDLYRQSDLVGQTFTLVGYGQSGTGSLGTDSNNDSGATRLKAQNRFDADMSELKTLMGSAMGWTPRSGVQLAADFDDGTSQHDALGQLMRRNNTGLGLNEGLVAPGDSGGPAFIGKQVAGIASYVVTLSKSVNPDIDSALNSSYGEMGGWQSVAYFQQWIDQSLRAKYLNAPTKPSEVKTQVSEGSTGTSYTYFLLNFTGVRSNASDILSVDYATRDGTAKAGQDYLAVSGTLKLYANENSAAVPVEVLGDTTPEPDETFYLDVTNPVGGSFGAGVVKLTAVRTILNDDGVFL